MFQEDSKFSSDYSFSEIGLAILYVVIGVMVVMTVIKLLWMLRQNNLMKKGSKNGTLLRVLLERDSEVTPFEISQMWTSFHSYLPWWKRLFKAQEHMSFEISSTNQLKNGDTRKLISFNFWVQEDMVDLVEERLKATYRYCEVQRLEEDYLPELESEDVSVEAVEFKLREDNAFAIKIFDDIEVDPLTSVLSSLSTVNENELAVMQVMLRPAPYKWNGKAAKILARYERTKKKPKKNAEWTEYINGFTRFIFAAIDHVVSAFGGAPPEIKVDGPSQSIFDTDNQKNMLTKVQHMGFETQMRLIVASPLGKEAAKNRLRRIMSTIQELNGPHNGFKKNKYATTESVQKRAKERTFNVIKNRDVLSTIEIAGFAHLVNKTTATPGIVYIQNKKQPFPNGISKEDPFAMAPDETGQMQPVGLDLLARLRHCYVSGMTGVGKSTLLENMILTDVERGRGVVVIDPHGELVDAIMQKMSTKRKDIYVLDPAGDVTHPFGLNLLEISTRDPNRRELEKSLVVDSFITMFKRVFGSGAIGPNTEDIFRMGCAAILDSPEGGGLLELLLILVNDGYRQTIIPHITDPIVKNYWEVVFPALNSNKMFATQNLNAPLNKIRRFLSDSVTANIICQKKSTIDVSEVINSGGVILARFSRGDMGFENSNLLGTILISKIQISSMQRVNIPMELRVPVFLYVDEFQNFVGDEGGAKSFAEILSEARKYRLGLVIAHQFLEQLKQSGGDFLLAAIFNNCGTVLTFRVGLTDAKFFSELYYNPDTETGYKTHDIANLGKFTIIARVMTKDGLQSHPFTAYPLPPYKANPGANPELIRERSRKLIGVKRDEVRNSIDRRAALDTVSSND